MKDANKLSYIFREYEGQPEPIGFRTVFYLNWQRHYRVLELPDGTLLCGTSRTADRRLYRVSREFMDNISRSLPRMGLTNLLERYNSDETYQAATKMLPTWEIFCRWETVHAEFRDEANFFTKDAAPFLDFLQEELEQTLTKQTLLEKNDLAHDPDRLGPEDRDLGDYVASYQYCSPLVIRPSDVRYLALSHEVHMRQVLPGGPQGFALIPLPKEVRTLSGLLRHLEEKEQVTLRRPVQRNTPRHNLRVVLREMQSGVVHDLTIRNGSDLVLGRSVYADVYISDIMVSRIHCHLLCHKGALYLRDDQSVNGSFRVRGMDVIRVREPVELREGDAISLAKFLLKIERIEAV